MTVPRFFSSIPRIILKSIKKAGVFTWSIYWNPNSYFVSEITPSTRKIKRTKTRSPSLRSESLRYLRLSEAQTSFLRCPFFFLLRCLFPLRIPLPQLISASRLVPQSTRVSVAEGLAGWRRLAGSSVSDPKLRAVIRPTHRYVAVVALWMFVCSP